MVLMYFWDSDGLNEQRSLDSSYFDGAIPRDTTWNDK
jgi:hypothetical protein